jgi:hypothetical protein
MKPYFTTSLLLVALATPALAAEHFAVVDTVGNCSVIDTKPSPYNISGLKVLGDQSGYSSPQAAEKALNSDSSQCKGSKSVAMLKNASAQASLGHSLPRCWLAVR